MNIRKRDGSYQVFDEEKIKQAIKKAFIATHNEIKETTLEEICDAIKKLEECHKLKLCDASQKLRIYR